MALAEELKSLAEAQGATRFGIADLTPPKVAAFIKEQGGEAVSGYPRGISVGIDLPDSVVDLIPQREELPFVRALYKDQAYDTVNARLGQLANALAVAVQRAAFKAFPVSPSHTVDETKLKGLVSNKLSAHLAGLGWIGRSCLLVTPDHGPRVRWATILTDAPLEPSGTPPAQRCGSCRLCVESCPEKDFTGRAFDEDEPREARYDVQKCYAYLKETAARTKHPICGVCLSVCPHGRKGARRA